MRKIEHGNSGTAGREDSQHPVFCGPKYLQVEKREERYENHREDEGDNPSAKFLGEKVHKCQVRVSGRCPRRGEGGGFGDSGTQG
ncbi:MAG: hypothetical protein ACQESR_16465 [Planctomycetota bacterium]